MLYEWLALGSLYGVRLVEQGTVPRDVFDEVRLYVDLSLVMKAKNRSLRREMGAVLTSFFKRHILGDRRARITQKRAEEFFAEDANFAACRSQSIGSMKLRGPFGPWLAPGEGS